MLLAWTFVPANAAVGSTLNGFTIAQPNPSLLRVQLDFVPQTPQYRIEGSGTTRVSVQFFGATRRPGVGSIPAAGSFIRAIDFVQNGTALALIFTSERPVQINVTPSMQSLFVLLAVAEPNQPAKSENGVPPSATDVSMIRLKYADVNEVAGLLGAANLADPFAGLANPQQLGGISSSLGIGGLQPGQTLTGVPLQQSASSPQIGLRISESVSIDRRLNAVIVSGPVSVTEPLKKLIALVDSPVNSVLLEATVVELTETAAKDVGIDFSSGGPLATGTLSIKSFAQPNATASLQGAIYAQVQRGQGRIIARPSILAQSGTPASINTGDSIPVFTNIAFPGSGSGFVQQQVQYVNVGVNLQIVATVDADNGVHARVIANVSSVTGFIQGVPQISQRQATTMADLSDRQSLVIGGLVQENELNNTARVPVLGSIPVIGGLFRVRHDRSQRTFLYIVITPTVMTTRGG